MNVSDVQLRCLWAVHAAAFEELTKIHGVVGVGLGVKETGGRLVNQLALIVYVREKRARERVAALDLIPLEYRGLQTDVQLLPNLQYFFGPTIFGGVQIRRLPDAKDLPKRGTLTYIATRKSDNQLVILSCEHVLLFQRKDERFVFHPDVSRCCGRLKHKIGVVIDGKSGHFPFNNGVTTEDYFVDAAIASINSDVTARKHIPHVGAIIGAGDISAVPTGPGSTPIPVKKVGVASGFTEGVVDDVAFTHPPVGGKRLIKIRPTSGATFPLKIRWKVPGGSIPDHLHDFPIQSNGGTVTQVGPDTLEFSTNVFAVPGDSGAPVVDASGRIVGIIVSGSVYQLEAFQHGKLGAAIVPTGFGIACHIQPVLDQLNLRIDPGTATIAADTALVPGVEISSDQEEVDVLQLEARLGAIEEELEETPAGRRLLRFVRTHAEELMHLVHHSKRVLVAWHRNGGPGWVALFIRSIREPDAELPRRVKDVPIETARERMYEVLMKEGSETLRAAMMEDREFVYGLIDRCRSLDELLAATRESASAPDAGVERV
jgi:hypothetical protein